jgi:hypothetical protein
LKGLTTTGVSTFTDDIPDRQSQSNLKHTKTPQNHTQAPSLIETVLEACHCIVSSILRRSQAEADRPNKASQRRQPHPAPTASPVIAPRHQRDTRSPSPVTTSLRAHFICRAPVLGLRSGGLSNRVVFVLPLSAKRGARFAPSVPHLALPRPINPCTSPFDAGVLQYQQGQTPAALRSLQAFKVAHFRLLAYPASSSLARCWIPFFLSFFERYSHKPCYSNSFDISIILNIYSAGQITPFHLRSQKVSLLFVKSRSRSFSKSTGQPSC